ncbi:DUF2059 domain-containing protein [Aestuariibius insulae]|uniref:DUF2059 domain-containing protein n=1 Tax=Aestuariibius insulae TaxID=2058287 RepID=UPI00345ECB6E
MIRHLTALAFAFGTSTAASAQSVQMQLYEMLDLPQVVEIARLEGLDVAEDMGETLFAGGPSTSWDAQVGRIYTLDPMIETVRTNFTENLSDEDAQILLDFFASEPGQTIVSLELGARRAMLDDEIEEASKNAASEMAAENGEIYQLVDQFISTNDLIDSNVAGALNSSLAFFRGLADGGDPSAMMGEQEMLASVWSQEGEIRADMTEWIYSFLLMAYQPLEEEDLEAYIALSETDAGSALNGAIFAAFEPLFEQTSYALGRAAAQAITSQDI